MRDHATAVGALVLAACSANIERVEPSAPPEPNHAQPVETVDAPTSNVMPTTAGPASDATRPAACVAKSLTASGPYDQVDPVDCDLLPPIVGGVDPRSCAKHKLDEAWRARFAEAVAPLDAATVDHMKAVARIGKQKGRNRRAFGLVGDSITAGAQFLGPFSGRSQVPVTLAPWVSDLLRTATGETIIDVYRDQVVEQSVGFSRDSFNAYRAAKVGAQSSWALAPDARGQVPLSIMVERVNPAIAVVQYGSNDAAARPMPNDELRTAFRERMIAIVDALETEGIVVILSTIPRRGPQDGLRHCGPDDRLNNARLMVQTTIVSQTAGDIACERALPLIDLRHAFDGLVSRGLYADGIHPSAHPDGTGRLDDEGLGCGYNARNLLVLHMLRQVRDALDPVYGS